MVPDGVKKTKKIPNFQNLYFQFIKFKLLKFLCKKNRNLNVENRWL